MSSIFYPVAETAEAALHAPLGYAAREREAEMLAASAVGFVSEAVGPAFATREAAIAAYGGEASTADGSGGRAGVRLDEAHGLRLLPVAEAPATGAPAAGRSLRKPLQPTYTGGRRWPAPAGAPTVLWRLSISFWRIDGASGKARRDMREERLGREQTVATTPSLSARTQQPLRPVKPQQPLDIGLFEMRPPEAPDTLIPDE